MATETKTKNENKNILQNFRSYLSDVRSELNKVSWPDRDDVIRLLRIVLLVTVITSLGLGALSIGLTLFLDQFGFDNPLILVIIFIAMAVGTWWSFRQEDSKSY